MAALQTWDEMVAGTLDSDSTIRENLQDTIHNVDPYTTPLLSRLQQIPVDNNLVQWLTDSFAAASNDAWLEGISYTSLNSTVPSRAANTTQIFYKGGSVSDRESRVSHAGMADPLAYYEGKKVIEIKKDMELALLTGAAASGTTNVASAMNGFMNVITTNATDLSSVTMTENIFADLLELTWTNTDAQPTDVYVGPKLKRTISGYNTNVTRNVDANAQKQVNTISTYESDFGTVTVQLHRNMVNSAESCSLLCIDPRYFATGWLQPLRRELLPRDGKRSRYQVSGEFTLVYGNEKAGLAVKGAGPYIA